MSWTKLWKIWVFYFLHIKMVRDENYKGISLEIKTFMKYKNISKWIFKLCSFSKSNSLSSWNSWLCIGTYFCIDGWEDPGHLHFSIFQLLCGLVGWDWCPSLQFQAQAQLCLFMWQLLIIIWSGRREGAAPKQSGLLHTRAVSLLRG